MPQSTRVNVIKSQFEFLKIPYTLQEAISGESLTISEINSSVNLRSCDARLGFRISKNLIGSGLSHREVYKKAIKTNSDWILILEEDVSITHFNEVLIFKIINKLNNEPTIVQLFTRASRIMENKSRIELSAEHSLFTFKPRLVGCGAQAYLINRKALTLALREMKLNGAPDWPPWAQKCKTYGVFPWLFHETALNSTVRLPEVNKRQYLCRRLFQLTGLHYLLFHREYQSFQQYIREEIYPYLLYLAWKMKGSKYYQQNINGPQVM